MWTPIWILIFGVAALVIFIWQWTLRNDPTDELNK
jgi:hypothetical protein